MTLLAALAAAAMTMDESAPAETATARPEYLVRRVASLPPLDAAWDAPEWQAAATLEIGKFHPRSSEHRPRTQARLLHDGRSLQAIFRVEDRYLRVQHTQRQDPVYQDSCVELFVQPHPGGGYFNLEMNAAGAFLLWYIEDPTREHGAFKKATPVPDTWLDQIAVHAELAGPIDPERDGPVTWRVSYRVPLTLFAAYAPSASVAPGTAWRGNAYKCADETSHPHWGAWADIGPRLDFHQPERFGTLRFED